MIARIFVFLLIIPRIFGWGREGHYATCKIAEGYLSEHAISGLKKLLPDIAEGELANVCAWPDEIRHHRGYGWSGPLHYIDTPDFACNYRYCRDCHDSAGRKDRCVTGAIYNYTMQLTSTFYGQDPGTKYNLTEAVMFLAHFIGDVHQPLHVGFTGDAGGNTIKVHWYHRKANLHHVWDSMIIDSAMKTFYNSNLMTMIQAIQNNITDDWFQNINARENCNRTVCPDPYASESIKLACKYSYRNATPGSTLGDEYFLSRLPVVEQRLAEGGVRLAALLNRIFKPKLPIAAE